MQQATLAQSVEQRIRNAQVVSSSLMSGSKARKEVLDFQGLPFSLYNMTTRRLARLLSSKILDHTVVEMAEEEDLAVGTETKSRVVGEETRLGLVNDQAYTGETFPAAD